MKKKYQVTIEESISQTFEVYAEDDGEAIAITEQKYANGEFVLDQANLVSKQMELRNETEGYSTEWIEF